jgi:hypothetical protein
VRTTSTICSPISPRNGRNTRRISFHIVFLVDFKTSTKERKDEWNENYYIQGSAYAEMFGERTGIEISQVVILVVTEDGTVQEFVRDKHEYLDALVKTVAEWSKQNETSSSSTGSVSVNG